MGRRRERGEGSRVTAGAGTPCPGPWGRSGAIRSPLGTERGGTGLPPTMGCPWLNPNSCVLLLLALLMLQVSVSHGGHYGGMGWWCLPVAPWRV